uniref:Uncharacterized protein n=1 Tax=Rhizophora mucronata TaxID=61149 RepID=A0A2P2PDW1_RHIMU
MSFWFLMCCLFCTTTTCHGLIMPQEYSTVYTRLSAYWWFLTLTFINQPVLISSC